MYRSRLVKDPTQLGPKAPGYDALVTALESVLHTLRSAVTLAMKRPAAITKAKLAGLTARSVKFSIGPKSLTLKRNTRTKCAETSAFSLDSFIFSSTLVMF